MSRSDLRLVLLWIATPMLLAVFLVPHATADEFPAGRGASAAISPKARQSLTQIQSLHRRSAPDLSQVDTRLLLEMQRCARRLKLLIGDTLGSASDSRRADALTTLRAEHARWGQLISELDLRRRGASGSAIEASRELGRRVDALDRTIDREVAATERIAASQDKAARDGQARAAIRRLSQAEKPWRRPKPAPIQSIDGEGR